ncbi:ATP-binding protein [Reichenbachiella sp. MALMAid0571]|uniref:sensor histidine kinase n=1 Tax=Reichenbachiella sp. MALMAid0571 TaxID=3143939 RepID=UPI0032DFD6D1
MIAPKEHDREKERRKELESYSILETLSETDYDNLTAIAAEICGTPISLVSLLDDKRQWFKSHHGIDATETPKEYAFCAHAINDPSDIFIIQDARKDQRFYDNPLVTGNPHIIFYAGVPLLSDNGLPLGTLCVIDQKPKRLNQGQRASLMALSSQVMNLLKLRKNKIQLEKALENLEKRNEELGQFAMIAAHDLKAPLNIISGMIKIFTKKYGSIVDQKGMELLELVTSSSDKLKRLIEGLLEHSRCEKKISKQYSTIGVKSLIDEVSGLFSFDEKNSITLRSSLKEIYTNKTAVEQILINLIGNAIKYSNEDSVKIEIGVFENETHYEFYVQDDGWGIAPEHVDKIFQIFEVVTPKDKYGQVGNGIGLATVKKIVEALGGTIRVDSELNKGSTFIFTLKKSK